MSSRQSLLAECNLIMSNMPFSDSFAYPIADRNICGECYLENNKFLVILSKNDSEILTESNDNSDNDKIYGLVVGSIQVKEQLYLIVEAKDAPSDLEQNVEQLLTQQEHQIATLVALGYSNQQIANRLKISEWAISTNLRRIFIKLDVTNRDELSLCFTDTNAAAG